MNPLINFFKEINIKSQLIAELSKLGLLHFFTAHTKSAEKNFFFSALFF